jgi:hypothetical protein
MIRFFTVTLCYLRLIVLLVALCLPFGLVPFFLVH